MGWLERQRIRRRAEAFIAHGVDLLEAGAPFPQLVQGGRPDVLHVGDDDGEGVSEYLCQPGRYKDVDLTVDLERLEKIAATHGVSTMEAMQAALRVGRRKAS